MTHSEQIAWLRTRAALTASIYPERSAVYAEIADDLERMSKRPVALCVYCENMDCDCLERIACENLSHLSCGWCKVHHGPQFSCGCKASKAVASAMRELALDIAAVKPIDESDFDLYFHPAIG